MMWNLFRLIIICVKKEKKCESENKGKCLNILKSQKSVKDCHKCSLYESKEKTAQFSLFLVFKYAHHLKSRFFDNDGTSSG